METEYEIYSASLEPNFYTSPSCVQILEPGSHTVRIENAPMNTTTPATPITTSMSWAVIAEKVSGGGGGGGGTGWENVPLTDTADYDTSCQYRYNIDYITDDINRKWMNANKGVGFPASISDKYLGSVKSELQLFGIPSATKGKYGHRDATGTFTETTNVRVTKMEKLCGGGGSGGGAGWADVSLTDTADFQVDCDYKFRVADSYPESYGLPAGEYWHNINGVSAKSLIYISHNAAVSHINATSKTIYKVNGGTPTYTVTGIKKRCGDIGTGAPAASTGLDCKVITNNTGVSVAIAACPADRKVMSGGCSGFFPGANGLPRLDTNDFYCSNTTQQQGGLAYAMCCK